MRQKNLLFLFCFLLGTATSLAQTYDSAYVTDDGVNGHAVFDYYYDIDHLMVKNGAYSFESNTSDTSWNTVYEKIATTGNYRENKKQGDWKYIITNHELDIVSIQDNHLDYNLRSFETELKCHYEKDIPSGKWELITYYLQNDQEPQLYEQIQMEFKKGYATGAFSKELYAFNGERTLISGQFEKGFFEGEWRFIYTHNDREHVEVRNYTKGVLEKLVRDGDTLHYVLSPKTQEVLYENGKSHLANKPKSLTFNDGYPRYSEFLNAQSYGNKLLKTTHQEVLRFDLDRYKKQKMAFGANRTFYPLTEEDEVFIGKWYGIEQELKQKVSDVREHEVREFGDSPDSIAVIVMEWVNKQEYLFRRFSSMSQLFLSKEVEYFYRDGLILDHAIQLLQADTIIYEENEIVVPYPVKEEFKGNLFSYLVSNFEERMQVGIKLDSLLYEIKSSATLEDELERLPYQIEKEKNKLDSLYAQQKTSKRVSELLSHIHTNYMVYGVEKALVSFNEMDNTEEKKQLGDSILVDLYDIKNIYTLGIDVSKRFNYIDSLYTEYVFDAFTFSDNVPARVKKRLYDHGVKIQNELIELATKSESPKECLEVVREIYKVQGITIYLRDKNTKELEKKLSRADSLEEKLELLHEVL